MKISIFSIDGAPGSDLAGSGIEKVLAHHHPDAVIALETVASDAVALRTAFDKNHDADVIITTGGTGIADTDIVPDVTTAYCDKTLPGIAEMMRWEAYKHSAYAVLSRATAGMKSGTIIINFPSSLKGALLCSRCISPFLAQIPRMIRGEYIDNSPAA